MSAYDLIESQRWFCYSGADGDLFRHAKLPGVRVRLYGWTAGVDIRRKNVLFPRGYWCRVLRFSTLEAFEAFVKDRGDLRQYLSEHKDLSGLRYDEVSA